MFRPPLTRCLAPLLLCITVSGCGGGPTEPSGDGGAATPAGGTVQVSGVPAAVVGLTNDARVRNGASELQVNAQLMQAAQLQADQIARYQRIDHVIPEGTYPGPADRLAAAGYAWSAYGENTAVGYSSAAAVVDGWMTSTGHRENILNRTFSEIGIGYTVREGRPYYVQVFGRPR